MCRSWWRANPSLLLAPRPGQTFKARRHQLFVPVLARAIEALENILVVRGHVPGFAGVRFQVVQLRAAGVSVKLVTEVECSQEKPCQNSLCKNGPNKL